MLGPRVLGQAEYERQQREAERTAAGNLGPRVVDAPVAVAEPEETIDSLSVLTVRKRLGENPLSVDPLLEAELGRPDPRRSALKSIYESEQRNQARPDVLERIRTAFVTHFSEGIDD